VAIDEVFSFACLGGSLSKRDSFAVCCDVDEALCVFESANMGMNSPKVAAVWSCCGVDSWLSVVLRGVVGGCDEMLDGCDNEGDSAVFLESEDQNHTILAAGSGCLPEREILAVLDALGY
jgi:hypothetical protein